MKRVLLRVSVSASLYFLGEIILQMRCSTHQGLRLSKADSTDGIHSVCSMVEI